jgi:hypothetical protein
MTMRRLAILVTILAASNAIEHIALGETGAKMIQARSRLRRVLVSLSDWRAFLIGPIRLFQRTTSSNGGPWLNLSN